MSTATTIREAVTQAVQYESDHWSLYLEEGRLSSAVVRNRIIGKRGDSLSDSETMRMATKYGRAFQQGEIE